MEISTQFNHVDAKKTAVMIDELKISYGRLAMDVTSLVAWLTDQGISARQRAGIFIKNPYWAWVARLAALRMGLTQVTLISRNFHEQIAATGLLDFALGEFEGIDGSQIAREVIICSPRTMAPFAEQFDGALQECSAPDPMAAASAQCLMLTSGTTGKPRAIALSAEMLRARLEVLQSVQGLTVDTVLLSTAGSNTMPGFAYTLATLQAGGCVIFTTSKESLRQLPINLLVTTPVELNKLLSLSPHAWVKRDTRKIIVAGGRLPVTVRDEALARICCQVAIDYGATETNCTATGDARLLDRHPGAVGFAVSGANIQVVDGQGRRQPPGKEGVVRTRTPYMVLEYGGNLECSPEGVSGDVWFYPGDLGVLFEDGLLAITGRLSEAVNIGGTKISLLDFEAPLGELPGLEEVCAIVLKLEAGDSLGILVVCSDTVNLQALSQKIQQALPSPVPFTVLRVATIPRNAMGKIPRNELSNVYSEICRRKTAG